MMEACGEAEGRLASELLQHEVQIEKDILDPLNQLAEVTKKKQNQNNRLNFMTCWLSEVSLSVSVLLSQTEIPNILKQRKQLAKLVLDYDSAKTR